MSVRAGHRQAATASIHSQSAGDVSSHLLCDSVSTGPAAGAGDSAQHVAVTVNPHSGEVTATSDNGLMKTHHHHATRSLILILALSLHRVFEGMTIGLQQTVTSVISLFGAVMCHEMVIGFSLGLQFVRSGFALRRLVVMSLVCSLIMPLGVLIGLVMTEVKSSGSNIDIANGLLQALAMGTFIYVTFFEILQEEVDSEDTSLGKIVFIAVGFAIMALLDLIPEEVDSAGPSYLNPSTFAPPVNCTLTV